MATKPARQPGPKRTPKGVDKVHPIALRLMPEERSQADRAAERLNISRSNLARRAYLKGLPIVLDETNAAGEA